MGWTTIDAIKTENVSNGNANPSSNTTKIPNNIIADEGLPGGPNYRAPHRNEYSGNNSKY